MKSALVAKNVEEIVEEADGSRRKKQRLNKSEISPNETDKPNNSFLSYLSQSTPENSQREPKNNCSVPSLVESTTKRKRKCSEEDEDYCYFKSDIDSLLRCPLCNKYFDHAENLPKIVCEKLTVCFNCSKTSTKIFCKFCDQNHAEIDGAGRTNSTILSLIAIKPIKINSEELVIKSKNQREITEIIYLSDLIGKMNSSLKLKIELLSNEVKNMKSKDDLRQCLNQVAKIRQTFCQINESMSQIDPTFGNKEIIIDNVVPLNKKNDTLTIYFDFDSLQDKKLFFPITKKTFFCIEPEPKQDCVDSKIKIINNKQELINQKVLKNFSIISTMVSFDESKNLVLILNSDDRQIICFYDIAGSFHNMKFVTAEKKIIYVNQSEIMIYAEKKKSIIVLDHDFNKKMVFGQFENEQDDFYFPKTGFDIILANEEKIAIRDLNKNCLKVMERSTGKYAHSFLVESTYSDKILVDKMKRLVLVHKNFEKVDFMDMELKLVKSIDLELDAVIDDFYVTYDNNLAFVNFDKCFIIFVGLEF